LYITNRYSNRGDCSRTDRSSNLSIRFIDAVERLRFGYSKYRCIKSQRPANSLATGWCRLMDNRVLKVREILDLCWMKPIHVSDLAQRVDLSTAYLQHLFKRETGTSIRQFVMARRLTTAARLLKVSRLSVKEVCYRVGFGNPANFHRSFKGRYGVGPAVYRKSSEIL